MSHVCPNEAEAGSIHNDGKHHCTCEYVLGTHVWSAESPVERLQAEGDHDTEMMI